MAVPPGVVTTILPLAPLPTVTVRLVALSAVMVAATPPMVTALALLRLVPVMVTDLPAPPLLGLNVVMVGAGMKVKVPQARMYRPGRSR